MWYDDTVKRKVKFEQSWICIIEIEIQFKQKV